MKGKIDIKQTWERLRKWLSTERSKNLGIYLLFVAIAAIFWLMITLDRESQIQYELEVQIFNKPDDVTFLADPPQHIRVAVRARGSALFRYSIGSLPKLEVNFDDYDDFYADRLFVSSGDLRRLVEATLGNRINIMSILPDTISGRFTRSKPKRVPVKLELQATANYQSCVGETISVFPDSVDVFGSPTDLALVHHVNTKSTKLSNLSDTFSTQISIEPISGIKISPNRVNVVIPVEPLILKRVKSPVVTKGVPYGVNLITFPSEVWISYLVPQSQYKENQMIKAEVYYDEAKDAKASKLRLYPGNQIWNYGQIQLELDSVEFVIENTN